MEGNHVAGFIHMCDDLGFDRAAWYVLDAMQNGAHSFEELEDIEDGCNVACDILEEYYDTKCGNAARQI
jgi:hypothetical protein